MGVFNHMVTIDTKRVYTPGIERGQKVSIILNVSFYGTACMGIYARLYILYRDQ